MQRPLVFLTFWLLFWGVSPAQSCLLVEVPLQERVQQSALIVEGEVVRSTPFSNTSGTLINTAHEVRVYTVYKGQLNSVSRVLVVTAGGQLGQQLQLVEPSLTLAVGDKGLFVLELAQYDGQPTHLPVLRPVAGPQGFVRYLPSGGASDVFQVYPDLQQSLYQPLQQWVQQAPQIKQAMPAMRMQQQRGKAPAITNFSPATVSAGTFSTFTITGSGFGTQSGQAEVAFSNANDGGATFLPVPASLIQSWSNTQIVVQVPMDAGSGPIRVTDASGASTTSSASVTIPYSVINVDVQGNIFRTYLRDINSSGGLTLNYNTNFLNYPGATDAFERALNSWRCGSFIHFDLSTVPASSTCQAQDGISIVNWDTACPLPQGILGQSRSNYSFCSAPLTIYLDDVDFIFAKQPANLSWNFTTNNSTNQQYDFESVALHELGHGHQLTHVIEPSEVMHFTIGPGTDKRVLSQQDIDGGDDVITFSAANTCGPAPHTPLNSSNCALGGPTASFIGVPQEGCAPLEVFFFDQSAGNPTFWEWDIDNDGIVDYTTKNIAHSYTQPGKYSVRLVVGNASGTDTLVQVDYINVLDSLFAFAGNDTFTCANSPLQLNGSAQGGDGNYTVSWSPATGLNSTQVFTPTASISTTTTFFLEVSDGSGCIALDTVVVTVAPSPVAEAGPDNEICSGESIDIGGNPSATGGTGGYTYSWLPDQPPIPGVANPIVTPTQTTVFQLTIADSLGCTSTDTVQITVLENPTADAGSPKKICGGESVTLGGSPSATGGAGGYTYLWLPNQFISSTSQANPTFSTSAVGTYTYTLQIFDAKGCVGIDSIPITVSPGVTVDAGIGGVICAGESVNLGGQPTASGGTGVLSYNWSPSSAVDNSSASNPTASPNTTTIFTVTVSDQAGCVAQDSIAVEVFPSPVADAGADKGLCNGLTGSTVIGGNPSGSGGTGQLTYNWSPSFGLNDATIANPTAAPGQATTYVLTVTDANGCADLDTMRVTINPPLVARAGTRDSVCQNACITLGNTPTAVGGDGNYNYNWSPAIGLDDPTSANPLACPAATTTYTLDLVDGKGCASQDTVIVVTKPAPIADFGVLDTSYCESDPVVNLSGTPANGNFTGVGVTANTFDPGAAGLGAYTLFYTVVNAEGCSGIDSATTTVYADPATPTIFVQNDTLFTQQGFAGYQWLFNGISIANANNYFLYRPAGQIPGVYEVIVTNENDCSSRSDEFTYTSVVPVWEEATVQLFPNPAGMQAQLMVQLTRNEDVIAQVYDLQGRLVWQQVASNVNVQQWILPTQQWAAGMYLILLRGESGEARLPLIVE